MFEEADADVLLLYDCCHSAATRASLLSQGNRGVTEVIAACGYEAVAPEVGEHSFSSALIEVLAAASKGAPPAPFSVAELHTRILTRLKCWTPSFVKDGKGKYKEDSAGRLEYERQPRRTPIYSFLCETEPRRSIVLAPLQDTSPSTAISGPSDGSLQQACNNLTQSTFSQHSGSDDRAKKRKRPADEEIEYPQVLLAIRLDKHELDLEAWKECLLRQLPAEAKEIKIEGIFSSFSTLLLLRLPVAVWDLLPANLAYSFIAFVTSENKAVSVIATDSSASSSVGAETQTTREVEPEQTNDLPNAHSDSPLLSAFIHQEAIRNPPSASYNLGSTPKILDSGTPSGGLANDKRFIIAIDFGTTFSSVSFLALPRDTRINDEPNAHNYLDEIKTIVNYPHGQTFAYLASRKEVPTEVWYAKKAYLDETLLEATNRPSYIIAIDDLGGDQKHNKNQDSDEDVDMEIDEDTDDVENKDTLWGYEVQTELRFPDTNRNQNRRMSRFKLLLDESNLTKKVRVDLKPNLKELKRKKIIKIKEDVIADYLKYLLSHVKNELNRDYGFSKTCPVEFVLCVPSTWTPKAGRIMQKSLEIAIRESGFGNLENDSIDNLFIVSEPEAAAAYLLASTTAFSPEEVFVVLDAGGGTVDTTTYIVHKTYPLRLKAAGFEAGGDLCGSSYLDEAFREHLRARLGGEDYLEVNGLTIESIIDSQVIAFENELKRSIDVVASNIPTQVVFIPGLRANQHREKRFLKNRLKIEHADLAEIFFPILERVAVLMRVQLQVAKEKGLNVKGMFLTGGFANSPSLRSYLTRELAVMRNYNGDKINMTIPQTGAETSVSSGALLRSLNKKGGPRRITRSSYGFLYTEEWEPDVYPAHRGIQPFSDPFDDRKYLKNTILWLIKKGEEIPNRNEYSIPVFYTFDAEEDTHFKCQEFLCVSDENTESHYQINHEKNRGATVIGVIETDMTFLKERNIIQPVESEEGVRAKRYYKIEYELVMIVNGRNMTWEVRYPFGGEGQVRGQLSIAAAFSPGTS
ncbi:hypothetical protein L207DRAFT_240865 [Hyaloscypha variabilis F]|uniref:Actin-like ATPase domain-containing protein n=1 Tax=Hyaloscypha variabilis (strain UAMH 11265 / GT02V1 / F) TaxID=1149755 RepID=A0A2J6S267_HYAVF|nr:hypothetical protein L207DRAFT_240865 [Hyaloscypha variabilis F]